MELYRKRLGFSNVREDMISHTAFLVNEDFEHSPHYKTVWIDNQETDAHVKNTRYSHIKMFTLRPSTKVTKGMYIQLNDDIYISTNPTDNEIYPKIEAKLCNNYIRWQKEDGNVAEYPCSIEGDSIEIRDRIGTSQRYLMGSEARVTVTVQYNEDTIEIQPKQRFIFNGHSYEVQKIDANTDAYKGVGNITLVVEAVSKSHTDNSEDGIADNSGESGWSGW